MLVRYFPRLLLLPVGRYLVLRYCVQVVHVGDRVAHVDYQHGLRTGLPARKEGAADMRAKYGVHLQLAGVGEEEERGV